MIMLNKNKSIIILISLCMALFSFNVYYFFIHRSVGLPYYWNKLINDTDEDDILKKTTYQSLVQEYFYLNKRTGDRDVIVFLGDSITKRFNIQEIFSNKHILNRGIFYDTTFGVLNRLEDTVNNLSINKIFIMIGYNDLKFRENHEILNNISLIISRVKANKVFVQSLLPVDSNRKKTNKRIRKLNHEIKLIVESKGLKYIDLYSEFVDKKGGINPNYTFDGTHPNFIGYMVWFSMINPFISEI